MAGRNVAYARRDHEAAFKWLKKSAEGGNAVAMWQLGEAMSVGRGCQVDDVQAREWYDRAKAAGLDAPPTQ
jgi:TPR repeat protein